MEKFTTGEEDEIFDGMVLRKVDRSPVRGWTCIYKQDTLARFDDPGLDYP